MNIDYTYFSPGTVVLTRFGLDLGPSPLLVYAATWKSYDVPAFSPSMKISSFEPFKILFQMLINPVITRVYLHISNRFRHLWSWGFRQFVRFCPTPNRKPGSLGWVRFAPKGFAMWQVHLLNFELSPWVFLEHRELHSNQVLMKEID